MCGYLYHGTVLSAGHSVEALGSPHVKRAINLLFLGTRYSRYRYRYRYFCAPGTAQVSPQEEDFKKCPTASIMTLFRVFGLLSHTHTGTQILSIPHCAL